MELYLTRVTESGNTDREEWIRFPQKAEAEVGIGRSVEHHVRLLSAHISRNHACLKKSSDGRFCIRDQNSLNGIHVNDTKIEPMRWQFLNVGNRVEIGRPSDEILSSMVADDRFLYTVKEADPHDLDEKITGPRVHMDTATKQVYQSKPKKIIPKRSNEESKNTLAKASGKDTVESIKDPAEPPAVKIKDYAKESQQVDNEMERENKRLKLELAKKELALQEEIEARNFKLEEEQKKIAAELEQNFKNQLVQKEEELEMRLQLEKDIALEEVKNANVEKRDKPSISVDTVVDTMENELQCSICSELFVVSTTLNCAHTFCEYCILQWKKVKNVCPVCRNPITTMTRSLVLDNYIEKVIESLSGDRKLMRTKVIKERKDAMEAQKSELSCGRGRGRRGRVRGRGRGRGGVRGRRGGRASNYVPPPTEPPVVIISDNVSSSEPDTSDLDSSPRMYIGLRRRHVYYDESESDDSATDYLLY